MLNNKLSLIMCVMGPYAKCQKCGKACVFRGLLTQKCVEMVCFWVVWPTQKGCFQILIYAHATALFAGAAPRVDSLSQKY